jgi:hypothetical protein
VPVRILLSEGWGKSENINELLSFPLETNTSSSLLAHQFLHRPSEKQLRFRTITKEDLAGSHLIFERQKTSQEEGLEPPVTCWHCCN